MIINEVMYKYVSARQLIWNSYCARQDGAVYMDDPVLDAFVNIDKALFTIVVGKGDPTLRVFARLRSMDTLPIMREIDRPGAWGSDKLSPEKVSSLEYIEFFSFNRYESHMPEYVRLSATISAVNGNLESMDILISALYIDFYDGNDE